MKNSRSKSNYRALMKNIAWKDRYMQQLKDLGPEIQTILENGPKNEREIHVIKICMSFTLTEILKHKVEFSEFQENDNG